MTWKRKSQPVEIIRNTLRVFCLLIFLLWPFGTYANCINYYDSISKSEKEDMSYDTKLEYGKEKKDITEIEKDILSQIEEKSGKNEELPRKWKDEELPKLEQLEKEIKDLEKKENKSSEEKAELRKKKEEYKKKLKDAKKNTIDNIRTQLKENGLTATDLNDGRNGKESLFSDPLRYFFISPLDKVSELMGLRKSPDNGLSIVGEMIFKLAVIKLFLNLISYWETSKIYEGMEKAQNPYLSVEEKEQIQQETSPLIKYWFFNGLMIFLFSWILLFFHPFFIDKTSAWYLKDSRWYYWVLPLFAVNFLSIISAEFLRKGRILKIEEIKIYLAKSLVTIIILNLLFLVVIPYFWGRSLGVYWFLLCNMLTDFFVNMISVGYFQLKSGVPSRLRSSRLG